MERGSGILMHISELPSPYGIGTFGASARRFVRFLARAKQKYWQILPLTPTGFGDSPYQSFSSFALNPYFIDLKYLKKEGLISREDLKELPRNNSRYIDYGKLYESRYQILYKAYQNGYERYQSKIESFYRANKYWLEDYAMFMTIKKVNDDKAFTSWPRDLMLHKKESVENAKQENLDYYKFQIFMQYLAFRQYKKLKKYANRKGIKIIGDMPIYVSCDSCEVWSKPYLFNLDRNRKPREVAAVPPDCYNEDGQLWGNPLYDYERMKKNHFSYFKRKFAYMAKLYDVVRVDHFRGFDSYYKVDAKETTAKNGVWCKGPGYELFDECKDQLSKVEIIAEDLGIITDSVIEMKNHYGFPGLKIYQFAFEDYENHLNGIYGESYEERFKDRLSVHYDCKQQEKLNRLVNPYLPHNYEHNSVAYLGTHDNETTLGYLENHPELYGAMKDYLKIIDDNFILDTLIGSLIRSSADVVIIMLQDVLHMGNEARINEPGKAYGNWTFRFRKDELSNELADHLAIMVIESDR